MKIKKTVYICAPLGGDVKRNLERAERYTRYALKSGMAPITTHFYALCLNDNNPEERKLGMEAGQNLLRFCDEIWIFGNEITTGMKEEILFCKSLKIPIKKISEEEVNRITGGRSNEQEEICENHSDNGNYDSGDVMDSNAAEHLGLC